MQSLVHSLTTALGDMFAVDSMLSRHCSLVLRKHKLCAALEGLHSSSALRMCKRALAS